MSGKSKDVLKFKKYALTKNKYKHENIEVRDCVLDTEKFIPFPKEATKHEKNLEKMKKMPINKKKAYEVLNVLEDKEEFNWHDWCVTNWGTKWGFCHQVKENEEIDKTDKFDSEIKYTFDTAWSPCIPVIIAMGKMFPTLTFDYRYFECGCGFNGILRIEKGKVTDNKQSEYFGDRGG